MNGCSLVVPTGRYTVVLPAEAVESLAALFPDALAGPGDDDPAARFTVEREADLWRLALGDEPLGRFATAGHTLLALEHRILRDVARSTDGHIAFHAGAVALGGAGRLLAGPPETGKTSTTVRLVELGATFVADEVALVAVEANALRPFVRAPALGTSFVDEAFPDRRPARGRLVELEPSLFRYVPERWAAGPVEVSSLLLPRYRRGAAPELVELDAGEALTEVLGYCFEPVGEPERLVDDLIGLLERWSIHRFTYGDGATARKTLRALFPESAGLTERDQD